MLQFHWKKFEGTDSWFRFCYLDVKFIKPPCYNESGLALGQMSRFFQKHDAVFHASIIVSLGRQRLLTGGLQAAESGSRSRQCAAHGLTRVSAGCASRGHLSPRAGCSLRARRAQGSPPWMHLSRLLRGLGPARQPARRTGPGQTTQMLPRQRYLPANGPRLCAARQSPGCRVIGPFKSKLSAAGNKTLPFNSGIIRSGLEPSRGKAFIEKRWENEI